MTTESTYTPAVIGAIAAELREQRRYRCPDCESETADRCPHCRSCCECYCHEPTEVSLGLICQGCGSGDGSCYCEEP